MHILVLLLLHRTQRLIPQVPPDPVLKYVHNEFSSQSMSVPALRQVPLTIDRHNPNHFDAGYSPQVRSCHSSQISIGTTFC
ncbi:MAG TPA: hypothetical protein VF398_01025 [bacterium]